MKLKLSSFFDNIHRKGDVPVFMNYIAGTWKEGKDVIDVHTPIDNSVIASIPQATEKDIKDSITAAHKSWLRIREIPGIERVEIFEKASVILMEKKEDFIKALMLEAGKPKTEAKGEIKATADRMKLVMEDARQIFGEFIPGDWAPDTTSKFALVIHEPRGVVAAISPFNYPLFIPAAKIVPSILASNTVVAKAATETPLSLLMFSRVLEEAGIPKGVLNTITGRGESVSNALLTDERISMVTFTGSTEAGKNVAEKAGLKKLHLELGGNGIAIVLDDCNIEEAATKCVEGSLKNCGQRCDAISVILVIDSIADEFVRKVKEAMDAWSMGDPRKDVKMGPLINESAARRVGDLVKDATEKGAKLLKGGRFDRCYFEPTLLDHVSLNARISNEETFGPVVTIIRIKDEDEAIEVGNRSQYGLDSCVFTNNFYRMWKIAKRLQVGGVAINDIPRHGVGYFPFGGSKESGIGREGIGYSIEEMTNLKTIVFNLEPAGLGKKKR